MGATAGSIGSILTLPKFHLATSKETQMCPGLNAYEIQIPHVKHHKVTSLAKSQFSQI